MFVVLSAALGSEIRIETTEHRVVGTIFVIAVFAREVLNVLVNKQLILDVMGTLLMMSPELIGASAFSTLERVTIQELVLTFLLHNECDKHGRAKLSEYYEDQVYVRGLQVDLKDVPGKQ